MEVSLLEADGIPEGCLISVRAGSTRRQAAAEANKPCKLWFPRGMQFANPFKVDLLAPLGSAVLEVNQHFDRYPIEVQQKYGGPAMNITLRVREESNKPPDGNENMRFGPSANIVAGQFAGLDASVIGAAASNGSPAQRHRAAIDARSYLDEHNLLQWVQGLLQELIKDRPGDPWTYIDMQTAKMRQKLGIPQPTPAAPAEPKPQTTEPQRVPPKELPHQPTEEPTSASKSTPEQVETAPVSTAEGGERRSVSRGPEDELRSRARNILEGEVERKRASSADQPNLTNLAEAQSQAVLPFAEYYRNHFVGSAESMARSRFARRSQPESTPEQDPSAPWNRAPSIATWMSPRSPGRRKAQLEDQGTQQAEAQEVEEQAETSGSLAATLKAEEVAPHATTSTPSRAWMPHPMMLGGVAMAGRGPTFLDSTPAALAAREEAAMTTGTLIAGTSTASTTAAPESAITTGTLIAGTSTASTAATATAPAAPPLNMQSVEELRVGPGACMQSEAGTPSCPGTPSLATSRSLELMSTLNRSSLVNDQISTITEIQSETSAHSQHAESDTNSRPSSRPWIPHPIMTGTSAAAVNVPAGTPVSPVSILFIDNGTRCSSAGPVELTQPVSTEAPAQAPQTLSVEASVASQSHPAAISDHPPAVWQKLPSVGSWLGRPPARSARQRVSSEAGQAESEVRHICTQARMLLVQACADSRLGPAIAEIMSNRQRRTSSETEAGASSSSPVGQELLVSKEAPPWNRKASVGSWLAVRTPNRRERRLAHQGAQDAEAQVKASIPFREYYRENFAGAACAENMSRSLFDKPASKPSAKAVESDSSVEMTVMGAARLKARDALIKSTREGTLADVLTSIVEESEAMRILDLTSEAAASDAGAEEAARAVAVELVGQTEEVAPGQLQDVDGSRPVTSSSQDIFDLTSDAAASDLEKEGAASAVASALLSLANSGDAVEGTQALKESALQPIPERWNRVPSIGTWMSPRAVSPQRRRQRQLEEQGTQSAPAPEKAILPFSEYYCANFKGASCAESVARSLFDRHAPKPNPMQPEIKVVVKPDQAIAPFGDYYGKHFSGTPLAESAARSLFVQSPNRTELVIQEEEARIQREKEAEEAARIRRDEEGERIVAEEAEKRRQEEEEEKAREAADVERIIQEAEAEERRREEEEVDDDEDVRKRAKELMTQGMRAGNLSKHLEEVMSSKFKAKEESDAAWERVVQPANDIIDPGVKAREEVKGALVSATMDGTLSHQLKEESPDSLKSNRRRISAVAREAVLDACIDGRLAESLQRHAQKQAATDVFNDIDVNKDGVISPEEFAEAMQSGIVAKGQASSSQEREMPMAAMRSALPPQPVAIDEEREMPMAAMRSALPPQPVAIDEDREMPMAAMRSALPPQPVRIEEAAPSPTPPEAASAPKPAEAAPQEASEAAAPVVEAAPAPLPTVSTPKVSQALEPRWLATEPANLAQSLKRSTTTPTASASSAACPPSGPSPPDGPPNAAAAPLPKSSPKTTAPPRHLSPQSVSSARSVTATPRPTVERLTPLASVPIVGSASAADLADTELNLRQRTERFRQENDALRKENARLKKLREAGDAAGMLCSQNDRLRSELGKLLGMSKKEGPFRKDQIGSASCPKF